MQRSATLTFAGVVSLPENRSALLAVQRVAACLCSQRRHRALNPLYLHGSPGAGKTYLLAALVDEVARRCPDRTAVVLAAREIAVPNSAARDTTEEADTLLAARDADLLIVEDLQFLSPRAAAALVRVFDDRHAHHKQMVFTASIGPRDLDLPVRLTSRLAWGLVVGLYSWPPASRLAYLRTQAQRRQLVVRPEVFAWLAEHLSGGGRELDGALARVEALSRMQSRPLEVAWIAEQFQAEAEAARPTVERIVQRVGGHFHVEPRQLQSSQRSRHVLLPRQVGMYLARQLTGLSLEQIGAYFGGRDHSTVLHACRKVEQALDRDAVLSGTVRQLRSDLM